MTINKTSLEYFKKNICALKQCLSACSLCPRRCGVDRTKGARGFCQAGLELEVAHAGLHHGEEPPLSGTKGSGAIFFRHCTLHCVYCQNWQISHPTQNIEVRSQKSGESIKTSNTNELSRKMLWLQDQGAHNINLVSPTQYLPQIAESLLLAKKQGLHLPIVYNTSGYEAVKIIKLLDGLIDIYLPDIKYSDNISAKKYSTAGDYVENDRAAIKEMFRQVGLLEVDGNGIARKGLLVRHLVLPEDIAGSFKSLDFLTGMSQDISISLMAQYSPQYQAERYPALNRKLKPAEYTAVVSRAEKLGLKNCWVQELDSSDVYLPDFADQRPFL